MESKDGVIADKKGMVIFYSVHTNQMDVGSLELKYIQLWTGMNSRYRFDLNDSVLPLMNDLVFNSYSSPPLKIGWLKNQPIGPFSLVITQLR